MKVIGLSGKARHGKGSIVQLAQVWLQKGDTEVEVRQVSFATALKQTAYKLVNTLTAPENRDQGENIAVAGLTNLGLPGHIAMQVVGLARGLTEVDLREKTAGGRRLLQFIGTEAFRKNVDDLYWVKLAVKTIESLPSATQIVFVPDCRFPNEADYVRQVGGEVWRVERYTLGEIEMDSEGKLGRPYKLFDNGLTAEQKAHPSETALDDYKFDRVLKATNMDDLFHAVETELKRLALM